MIHAIYSLYEGLEDSPAEKQSKLFSPANIPGTLPGFISVSIPGATIE